MKLIEFSYRFPTEESCIAYFRQKREANGIVCKQCKKKTKHYWFNTQKLWKCSGCGSRTNLKAGTIMHKSKMPILHWFYIIHLMTATKKAFSALEIQRQVQNKRYEPTWLIMQKIRIAMGESDSKYQLSGDIEMDEAFYGVVMEKDSKTPQPKAGNNELKRGKGSQRQAKVLVMAESTPNPHNKNKHRPSKALGHIKMVVIENLKYPGINYEAKKGIVESSEILTDGLAGFKRLEEAGYTHVAVNVLPKESSKTFPWVNTVISNSKRLLLGTNHSIGRQYLQNYLNDFCYKLNHRHSPIDLFEHAIEDCISVWGG